MNSEQFKNIPSYRFSNEKEAGEVDSFTSEIQQVTGRTNSPPKTKHQNREISNKAPELLPEGVEEDEEIKGEDNIDDDSDDDDAVEISQIEDGKIEAKQTGTQPIDLHFLFEEPKEDKKSKALDGQTTISMNKKSKVQQEVQVNDKKSSKKEQNVGQGADEKTSTDKDVQESDKGEGGKVGNGNKDSKTEDSKKVNELKEKEKKEKEKKEAIIEQAVWQRKIVRFVAYLTILILVATIVGISCAALIIDNGFISKELVNLKFTIDNCTLVILDKEDSGLKSPVYVKYHVPTQLLPNSPTTVTVNHDANFQTLEVLNGFDPRYCYIHLYVKPQTPLGSISINCPHCNITQDTSFQLEIRDELRIKGQVVYANFVDIKVGSLNYKAFTGFLQLNNIDTFSTANAITMERQGDIIIQSTRDFQVDARTDTQAFCFSAPALNLRRLVNCALSGQNSTDELKTKENCRVVYDICTKSSCIDPPARYTVISKTGNVYANLIPSVGNPVSLNDSLVVKGQIYDDGIQFSPEANETVSNFDELVSDQSKGNPFVVLDLGNIQSASSKYTRWVISSTPSYSYIRPWWIGTFSGGVLNGYVEQVNGFLLPGFCPFFPEYTTENLLEIQNFIEGKIQTLDTLITFINDDNMPLPPATPRYTRGIFPLIPKGNPSDYWFSLTHAPNGKIVLDDNDYTKRPAIMAAIIVSGIIAIYVSYLALNITFVGIDLIYTKLLAFANHLTSYAKLEKEKGEKAPEEPKNKDIPKPPSKLDKYSFINILRNSPSPSAFIDYFTLIVYRQFTSSVTQFYHLLFKEATEKQLKDQEIDPKNESMKGSDVKLLYEKFCFVNHINEEKLTDPINKQILRNFGFKIANQENQQVEVFQKIIIKNRDPFLVDVSEEDERVTSLDIYMKKNVDVTQFQEDQIEVAEFAKLYYEFCDFNRLPHIVVSPLYMKEKYEVTSEMIPLQMIVRIQKTSEGDEIIDEADADENKSLLRKPLKIFSRKKKNDVYVIDTKKLTNHFNLVMEKYNLMTDEDINNATKDLILYPRWFLWDVATVFLHILVGSLMTIPLIGLAILNESQYEPWSLQAPYQLIRFEDILNDPTQLIINLANSFTWNVVILFLVGFLWIMNFFDLMLYYAVMEFPQDKSFKKSQKQAEENRWRKISRQLEWILMLSSLACYFAYIGLTLTWLLLGAFINPNAFLPFASAAVTFVTFLVSKYKAFKELLGQGTKAVMEYVEKLFGKFMHQVLHKMVDNILKDVPTATAEKMKSFVSKKNLKKVTGKLVETGILDAEVVNGYMKLNEEGEDEEIEVKKDSEDKEKKSEETFNIEKLRQKTITKIKEECKKREINENLTDLLIAVSTKENEKTKEALKKLLDDYQKTLLYPTESTDMLIGLLLPQGLNMEDTMTQIFKRIVKLSLKTCHFDDIPKLSSGTLIQIFNLCKNLEYGHYKSVSEDLEGLLNQTKAFDERTIKVLTILLEIVSILANNNLDRNALKESCLKLLHSLPDIPLPPENSDKLKYSLFYLSNTCDKSKPLPRFTNFISMILSSEELPDDMDKIIDAFSDLLKLDTKSLRSVINYLTLMICYARQDIYKIPKETFKSIESKFNAQMPNTSTFLSTWFSLIHTAFYKPVVFYRNIDLCLKSYGAKKELRHFIKFVSCYSLKDFEDNNNQFGTQGRTQIILEKNTYFLEIVNTLKVDPKELLGLIDLIYEKTHSKYIGYFMSSILSRVGLKDDIVKESRALLAIIFSNDESELLGAAKTLNLTHQHFLLAGSNLLKPLFITNEQLKEVGVEEEAKMTPNKHDISDKESLSYWKDEVRRRIKDSKKQEASDEAKNPANKKEIEKKREPFKNDKLIKFYLKDRHSFEFSKKNIEEIIIDLSNDKNKLKDKFIGSGDTPAANNGANFLSILIYLKQLKLVDGKRYETIDKEKKTVIYRLSEIMGLDHTLLRKFIKLFVKSKKTSVCKSFFEFFPKEQDNKLIIEKSISYALSQAYTIQEQYVFLTKHLAESIKLPEANYSFIPNGMVMNIVCDRVRDEFQTTDLLELVDLKLSLLKLPPDPNDKQQPMGPNKEEIFRDCYNLSLFIKGQLDRESIQNLIKIEDKTILDLLDIFTELDPEQRYAQVTKLFAKDHPLKIAIAFYGLLNNLNFKIRDQTNQEESIKSYLSKQLNIYPETFDLFEIIFYRNPSEFFQKALPIIRRFFNSSALNLNLIESLFMMSLGEHFNHNSLARRLAITPDIVDFFICLRRLSIKAESFEIQTSEFERLPTLFSVNKVLSKLKVKPKELIALGKLTFNMFKGDETIEEMLSNLNFKDSKSNDKAVTLNSDLFKSFVAINEPLKTGLEISKNKVELAWRREKALPLFQFFGLGDFKENAFIISSLASGNFLVLQEYKQELNWIFPSDDQNVILKLTMGLCGILNSDVHKPTNRNESTKPLPESKNIVSSNSLAYAINLLYDTAQIVPEWLKAFVFDEEAFNNFSDDKNISEQFLWAIVLNFANFQNIISDIFGLYEWTNDCLNFYDPQEKEFERDQSTLPANVFLKKIDKIDEFFANRFNFDCKKVYELAKNNRLIQYPYWSKLFEDKTYNQKVNQSIFALVMEVLSTYQLINENEKKSTYKKMVENAYGTLDPSKFFEKLVVTLKAEITSQIIDWTDIIGEEKNPPYRDRWSLGRLKREAIAICYKKKTADLCTNKKKFEKYPMTDLSILGLISFLRTNRDISTERKIYTLNQIMVNLERKFYLDDHYYKMSKFKIMKLVGISLGIQVTNLSEFYLLRSLFDNKYVTKLVFAGSDKENKDKMRENGAAIEKKEDIEAREARAAVRKAQIKQFILGIKPDKPDDLDDLDDEDEEEKPKNYLEAEEFEGNEPNVSDLGAYTGSYKIFNAWIEDMLEIEDWDNLMLFLRIDEIYEDDPKAIDFENYYGYFRGSTNLAQQLKLESDRGFRSSEIIKLIRKEKSFALKQKLIGGNGRRLKYSNDEYNLFLKENYNLAKENFEPKNIKKNEVRDKEGTQFDQHILEENLFDVKTNLSYKVLLDKASNFEETLIDPNMQLIQGIIQGDPSKLIEGDHILLQGDPEQTVAKVYMALLGLQSYMKKEMRDKKQFNNYLLILGNYIQSDISILGEILNFLVTGRADFLKTITKLDIQEKIMEFLLYQEKSKQEDSTNAETKTDEESDLKAIANTLNIPFKDFEMFQVITGIYLLNKERWSKLLESSFKSNKPQKSEKGTVQTNHPLKAIIDYINFENLKKQVAEGEDRRIISSFNASRNQEDDMILTKIVFQLESYKNNSEYNQPEKQSLLQSHFYLVKLIMELKLQEFFRKLMIVEVSKQDNSKLYEKWLYLENMETNVLQMFNIKSPSPAKKDTKILGIYLSLYQGNLATFKDQPFYMSAINDLISQMKKQKLLPSLKDYEGLQDTMCRFLVSTLSWDTELFLKEFMKIKYDNIKLKDEEYKTLNFETYAIYSLCICLQLDKFLALGTKEFENVREHIEIMLDMMVENTISKTFAKNLNEGKYKNKRLLKERFSNKFNLISDEEIISDLLSNKIDEFFETLKSFKHKPKPLIYHISKVTDHENLTKWPDTNNNKNFERFSKIVLSICNGNFPIDVIENSITKPPAPKYVEVVKRFWKLIIKITDYNYQKAKKVRKDKLAKRNRQNNPEEKKNDQDFNSDKYIKEIRRLSKEFIDPISEEAISSLSEKSNKQIDQECIGEVGKIFSHLKEVVPQIIEMYLVSQDLTKSPYDIKVYFLSQIPRLTKKEPKSREFIQEIMSIILGVEKTIIEDQEKNGNLMENEIVQKNQRTIEFFPNSTERVDRLFSIFQSKILTDKKGEEEENLNEWLQNMYELNYMVRIDFIHNYEDKQKIRQITEKVFEKLEAYQLTKKDFMLALMAILRGDFNDFKENAKKIIELQNLNKESDLNAQVKYMIEARDLLTSDFFNNTKAVASQPTKSKVNKNPEDWADLLKKIKEGKASARDLFSIVDEAGDNSGAISQEEFQVMANRLNLKLTNHRIKEIFAKVKGIKGQDLTAEELNAAEFEKALDYLQQKNINQALQLLGITPEILAAVLIKLTILLLLIFTFIFLGIKAFAVGGTFGSIINSFFPAAGGMALGKEKEGDKDKLDEDNVQEATDKGFEIATSDEL